jgi:hypothetical protein
MQTYTVTVDSRGTVRWYQNNLLHRLDGPAIEYADGSKDWYQNGKLHRTDGPAVEYADGTKEYWIEGLVYNEHQFIEMTKPVKELSVAELEKLLGYKIKLVDK